MEGLGSFGHAPHVQPLPFSTSSPEELQRFFYDDAGTAKPRVADKQKTPKENPSAFSHFTLTAIEDGRARDVRGCG